MTILFDNIENIAGARHDDPIVVRAISIRENQTGSGIITDDGYSVWAEEDGSITTPDLDPGPAVVVIGGQTHRIEIPVSTSPIRLWPLIDAQLPAVPADSGYVRNAGGVARIQVMTETAYAALTNPDPETLIAIRDA